MPVVPAPHKSRIYHNLSRFYDRIFTRFFMRRIHSTIAGLDMPPTARVLEVGVGTGLSLPAYPAHAEVLGIDLSPAMLQHAQEKIEQQGYKHITLRQMDALNLELPDASFDYVMAFHIVTVVPDCGRLVREITRVCKPGGTIVIINHLRSPRRWIAALVDLVSPFTHLLGWRTTLSYEELVGAAPIKVVRRFKTSPRSLFTVIIAEKPTGATVAS
jgi:phosphatidylethanolamine/phosphatidyl-N-methylethanolamine N-methyltransferase